MFSRDFFIRLAFSSMSKCDVISAGASPLMADNEACILVNICVKDRPFKEDDLVSTEKKLKILCLLEDFQCIFNVYALLILTFSNFGCFENSMWTPVYLYFHSILVH